MAKIIEMVTKYGKPLFLETDNGEGLVIIAEKDAGNPGQVRFKIWGAEEGKIAYAHGARIASEADGT